jgi:hypothetical protein
MRSGETAVSRLGYVKRELSGKGENGLGRRAGATEERQRDNSTDRDVERAAAGWGRREDRDSPGPERAPVQAREAAPGAAHRSMPSKERTMPLRAEAFRSTMEISVGARRTQAVGEGAGAGGTQEAGGDG